MKTRKFLLIGFFALVFGGVTFAQKSVMVGAAEMCTTKNSIENNSSIVHIQKLLIPNRIIKRLNLNK